MPEPAPAWLLVTLCAAAGAYCVLRMRSGCAAERRTAGSEALMGFGMAAMAVPVAAAGLPGWAWLLCAAVFAASAVSAARPAGRDRHRLHHVVGSLAMVHMAVAMAQHGGGASSVHGAAGHTHGGTGVPVLTAVLLLYFAAHALHTGARLVPVDAPAAPGPGAGWAEWPELVRVCRLAMSIAMLAMLLGV